MRDYKVEQADSNTGLEKKVRNMMSIGWQPIGGVSVSRSFGYGSTVWTQAMVLYDNT